MTLSFREAGTGFPVVCLHASAGGSGQWRTLMAGLADRYRILAPNRIGYGGNAPWPTDRPAKLEDEVTALAPLLDTLGPSFALVGHSFGGVVALKAALRHPERVRALVVYEPVLFSALIRHQQSAPIATEFVALAEETTQAVKDGDLAGAAARFVDYWNGPGSWDATPVERRGAIQDGVRQLPAEWESSLGEPNILAELATLTTPTLYLAGTASPAPARALVDLVTSTLPRCELREFEGVGHMGPITHPDRVNSAIEQFLDRTLSKEQQRAA